jgi:surfeit locus 1 family protein
VRSRGGRIFLPTLCLVGTCLFSALAVWQFERRVWKLDLIERVEARLAEAPVSLPPRSDWNNLAPRDIEYLRVSARGRLLHERETLVDALTERGPGYWVLTPLRTEDGTVLVNRGFVPPERRRVSTRQAGQVSGDVSIVGLARVSEPGGRVLRPNVPGKNRWYSRDVEAIASARGLRDVAPYFIDAGSSPNPGGFPVGGMTVVNFRNVHLVYALTWLGLALISLGGLVLSVREVGRSAGAKVH